MHATFDQLAKQAAREAGRPRTFVFALCGILAWAASGFVFGFSDTWQLVVNTATTIITFLMVFLLQNTQSRDTGALQLKLDELIRSVEGAHKALLDLEELGQDDLDQIRKHYEKLAHEARENLRRGKRDTDTKE